MAKKEPIVYRKYFCPVCGHVEWIAEGEELAADYRCPLCDAPAKAMALVGGAKFGRHRLELEQIAPSIWRALKKPRFQPDYEHFAYLIQHPQGLYLYDAPPIIGEEAIDAVRALGSPRALVASHGDFVGFADAWAKALGVLFMMGPDKPLPGNLAEADTAITEDRDLAEGLRLMRTPGHSAGSVSLYWADAPGGPALFAGDALCLWRHRDGRVQLSVFQAPPPHPIVLELIQNRPVSLLATCMGHDTDPQATLKKLASAKQPCARPYLGELGGVWR